jgi:AhpD family alkylhydroperoxidase
MNKSPKAVVVTDSSKDIGAEVVKAFRKLDYRIVVTSRSIKQSDDENILSIAGDIGDPTTAQCVISEGVARFGRIDTLVNNAGVYIGKPFTEHTAEDYAAVMNVNMAGFYHITQLAIAEMEKHSSKSFDLKTRESITLADSEVNGCNYCLGVHSHGADLAKMLADGIILAGKGHASDPKRDAAVQFARKVIETPRNVVAAVLV